MADDLTSQIDAEYDKRAQQAAIDAEYEKRFGPNEFGAVEGMARQAVHTGTLHADSYLTSPDSQAKLERWSKANPVKSTIADAAGIVAPMFTPAGPGTLVARLAAGAPRVASFVRSILPYANFSRATDGAAGLRTVMHESGIGTAKAGAMMRFNDPVKDQQPSGDATTDWLNNVAARGMHAGDLPSMAWDYGGGAAGGYVGNKIGGYLGNRIGELGDAAAKGRMPGRTAVTDVAHEIGKDSPTGSVADTLEGVRNLVYGEGRTLGRHGGGAIPQAAEREMARQFQQITAQGYTDAQASQILGRYWQARTGAAQRAIANPTGMGPTNHPDAWLLARGGQPYTPGTMGEWGRTAGIAYRNRNQVPSNLTELVALASGGEAPALQTTLRKLLNLGSEGGNRSSMLRELRERQGQIKGQMGEVLRRYLGNGDVGQAIAEHEANARNANALYPQIFDSLRQLPDANDRISNALHPILDAALKRGAGPEQDEISSAVAAAARKFMNESEQQLASPSMQPLTSKITQTLKDDAGNVTGKVSRQVPLTEVDANGRATTSRFDMGSQATSLRASGDLESLLQRRRVLRDAVDTAYRGGQKNLGHDLKGLHDQIDQALRGLGRENGDPFERSMAQWAAANDTRAMAGQLERTHQEALGLNLKATKGEGLANLERFYRRFQGMDGANQDMARRGIMGQFKAMLETGGDMHDAAKIFSNRRTREILSRVIGPEATEEFGGFVARSGLATNTFNMNKGSQTASILDSDKSSGWLENIASALWKGNPLRAVGHMGEMAGDVLKRRKHDAMTQMLRSGTHDPAALERALEQIRTATAPAHPRLQALTSQGRTVGTGTGIAVGKRRDQ
jgi:hypothetical protein